MSNDIKSSNERIISRSSFENCSNLLFVNISKGEYIGSRCFANCFNLTNVLLGNVWNIKKHAFLNCSSIQKLESDKLEIVYENAFESCTSLEIVNFSKLGTFGGDCIFKGCSSLSFIHVPSLKSVDTNDTNIFEGCINLSVGSFPENPPNFSTNIFDSTKKNKVNKKGHNVYDVTLCLPYRDNYSNYDTNHDQVWNNILSIEPDNYENICIFSKETKEDYTIIIIVSVISGIILISSIIAIILIHKRGKN